MRRLKSAEGSADFRGHVGLLLAMIRNAKNPCAHLKSAERVSPEFSRRVLLVCCYDLPCLKPDQPDHAHVLDYW
jgi:hypothetical protein